MSICIYWGFHPGERRFKNISYTRSDAKRLAPGEYRSDFKQSGIVRINLYFSAYSGTLFQFDHEANIVCIKRTFACVFRYIILFSPFIQHLFCQCRCIQFFLRVWTDCQCHILINPVYPKYRIITFPMYRLRFKCRLYGIQIVYEYFSCTLYKTQSKRTQYFFKNFPHRHRHSFFIIEVLATYSHVIQHFTGNRIACS